MAIENEIERQIFARNPERTSMDKILGRKDIEAMQELSKKSAFGKEDMLAICGYLSGMESKIVNLSEHERFGLLKFYVWIEDFVKMTSLLYELKESCKEKDDPQVAILLQQNIDLAVQCFKFLSNLYMNISRTSLSMNAAAFRHLLETRYDINYQVDNKQLTEAKK